jgi:NADPH-dependent 7-cyano-7-deazaguanine reductase QueF
MIESIDLPYRISGTKITLPFKAVCTVTNKEFGGDVIVEYQPTTKALEYVDAEKAVNKICSKEVTAEEMVHLVFEEVKESISPAYLKVTADVKYSDAHKPVMVWLEF